MGNQLLKLYNIDYDSEIDGGRYTRWKVFLGTHKERAYKNERASIFIFDKKVLDRLTSSYVRNNILETLRKDVLIIQRLVHPFILHVIEPLYDERNSLAFATSVISSTLFHYLKTGSKTLSIIEIKCGILDICRGLEFLHKDAKLAHLAISPHSIFLNELNDKWLIGGLGHAKSISEDEFIPCSFNFSWCSHEQSQIISENPPLCYCSPEMTEEITQRRRCSKKSDIFSLGLIFYELLVDLKKPIINVSPSDISQHQKLCKKLLPLPNELLNRIDIYTKELLEGMLQVNINERFDINQVLQHPALLDTSVKAIKFLEEIKEKDENSKIVFFKGFHDLIQNNSNFQNDNILINKVIPQMLINMVSTRLYSPILSNVFTAMHKLSDPRKLGKTFWEEFSSIFVAKEIPIQSVHIILNELEFMCSIAPSEILKNDLMPLILKCLDIEGSIQDFCLGKIGDVAKSFDCVLLKNYLLPKVLHIIINSSVSKVRKAGISAVTNLCSLCDRSTLINILIPALDKIRKSDKSPGLSVCISNALEEISKYVGIQLTAELILPVLTPCLMDDKLSQSDFKKILQVIRKMIDMVEENRMRAFRLTSDNEDLVKKTLLSPNEIYQNQNNILISFDGLISSQGKHEQIKSASLTSVSSVSVGKDFDQSLLKKTTQATLSNNTREDSLDILLSAFPKNTCSSSLLFSSNKNLNQFFSVNKTDSFSLSSISSTKCNMSKSNNKNNSLKKEDKYDALEFVNKPNSVLTSSGCTKFGSFSGFSSSTTEVIFSSLISSETSKNFCFSTSLAAGLESSFSSSSSSFSSSSSSFSSSSSSFSSSSSSNASKCLLTDLSSCFVKTNLNSLTAKPKNHVASIAVSNQHNMNYSSSNNNALDDIFTSNKSNNLENMFSYLSFNSNSFNNNSLNNSLSYACSGIYSNVCHNSTFFLTNKTDVSSANKPIKNEKTNSCDDAFFALLK